MDSNVPEARTVTEMELLDTLVGVAIHDLTNLLLVIGGHNALLLDQLHPSDPRRRHAEEIQRAVDQAIMLIHQVLTVGHRHGVTSQGTSRSIGDGSAL